MGFGLMIVSLFPLSITVLVKEKHRTVPASIGLVLLVIGIAMAMYQFAGS